MKERHATVNSYSLSSTMARYFSILQVAYAGIAQPGHDRCFFWSGISVRKRVKVNTMSNVTGIFNTAAEADNAIMRLVGDGFSKDNISLIRAESGKMHHEITALNSNGNQLAEGGFTGIAIGIATNI